MPRVRTSRTLLLFSFHFPPDQSAGALRSSLLVTSLLQADPHLSIIIFASKPTRYGLKPVPSDYLYSSPRVTLRRFWIPYFGQSPFSSLLSYLFYFCQSVPSSLFVSPDIIVGTSAKLLTSLAAALASRITGAHLFIDFRDTFADNFFYFYRWNKRILFQSLIMAVENVVLRSANSVNIVSVGFHSAFLGWERVLRKYSISLTNYPNGILRDLRNQLSSLPEPNPAGPYIVTYAGNLGEGQDIFGLLLDLSSRPDVQRTMVDLNIKIHLYGGGSQLRDIKSLLDPSVDQMPTISGDIVKYMGIVPRNDICSVYGASSCLMLQLGMYSSLSLVIPSKLFEYASTDRPIIYGASGFTSSFIQRVDSTEPFVQNNSLSLVQSIKRSRDINVDLKKRADFLSDYDVEKVYTHYASHILRSPSNL